MEETPERWDDQISQEPQSSAVKDRAPDSNSKAPYLEREIESANRSGEQEQNKVAWWHGPLHAVRALVETVIPALLIAVGINLFLAQATQVQGQSMEPNLHTAQRLVVEKVTYRFHGPRRGDIVVIDLPEAGEDLLIKRVVGLPGETISSQNGEVFINEEPIDEPYIRNPGGRDVTEQLIPPLHVFVMGDNRRFSNDSRNFGPVPIDNVIGRAWFSYWPLELWGPVE